MAATSADAIDVTIDDDEALRWYAPDAAVAYGFCVQCGSTMFWRQQSEPSHLSIAAGTIDPPTGLRTAAVWYADQASDYHDLPVGPARFAAEP